MIKETFSRANLIDAVHRKVGVSKAEAADLVTAMFKEMMKALTEEKPVKIKGFGTFLVKRRKGYTGCNPKTMKPVQFQPCKGVRVHFAAALKDAIAMNTKGRREGEMEKKQ